MKNVILTQIFPKILFDDLLPFHHLALLLLLLLFSLKMNERCKRYHVMRCEFSTQLLLHQNKDHRATRQASVVQREKDECRYDKVIILGVF
jgi:hypothetical protein